MANKTVIQLHMSNCGKCKKVALHSVTKIEGIDSLTINLKENKLTVIGDADPVCMFNVLRKKFRCAQLLSFGPVPPPPPPPPPKPPKLKCQKCGKEFDPPKLCPACEAKCKHSCSPCCASCKPPCSPCSPPSSPCRAPCKPPPPSSPCRAPCKPQSSPCYVPCSTTPEILRPPYHQPYAPHEIWYLCSEDKQESCNIM